MQKSIMILLLLNSVVATAAEQPFVYAKGETESGRSYEGMLQWDDEEVYWHDIINGTRLNLAAFEALSADEQRLIKDSVPGPKMTLFGMEFEFVKFFDDPPEARMAYVRHGDIAKIEVLGEEYMRLTLKGGAQIEVRGGSNDLEADLHFKDETGDVDERNLNSLRTITFSPAPANAQPHGTPISGTVTAKTGTYTGTIQWDMDERLGEEKLDGDDLENEEHSIAFKDLRFIRSLGNSSEVGLKDGTSLTLEDSNDVDDDNRGVIVDNGVYRVHIEWSQFEQVQFDDSPSTPTRSHNYDPSARITGTITTTDGQSLSGPLTWNLHQQYAGEHLHAEVQGMDFFVPFAEIAAIEPIDRTSMRVTLRNGETVTASKNSDVDQHHFGIVVHLQDGITYIPRSQFAKLVLDWPTDAKMTTSGEDTITKTPD